MTITIAKLQVYIGADIKEATSGLKQVGEGLRKLSGDGKGIKDIFVGVLGANLLQNGITAFKNLGLEAVNVYGTFEQMGLSLQALAARELFASGGATTMAQAMKMAGGAAEDLLEWVKQLALKSPFDQAGVAKALQTAMAYGFTAKEAQRMTEAMIDFSAAGGGSTETMNRIALALGQIKAKGSLAGQEILQLTEAGIDVNGTLARAFGKTTQEIVEMREKGLIPAEDAINAIVDVIGGDFEGAAAAASGTLTGLVNTLGEIKDIGIRELFGPFFEEMKPKLQEMILWLQDEKTVENIREMGKGFAETAMQLIDGAGKVIDWWINLDEKSQKLIVSIATIGLLAPVVTRTFGDIAMAGAAIVNVLPNIVAGLKAFNSGMSITSSLGAAGLAPIAITLGSIALAAGAVAAVWYTWNKEIAETQRVMQAEAKDAWIEHLEKQVEVGKTADGVLQEFTDTVGRVNEEYRKGGILAALFIDKHDLMKGSIEGLNDALLRTTGSYEEYLDKLITGKQIAGELTDEQASNYRGMLQANGALDEYAKRYGALADEMVSSGKMTREQADAWKEAALAQVEATTSLEVLADGIGAATGQEYEHIQVLEKYSGLVDNFEGDLRRLALAHGEVAQELVKEKEILLSVQDVYATASPVLQEYGLDTATLAETFGMTKEPAEQLKEDIVLLSTLYGEGFISLESYNKMMEMAAEGELTLSDAARQAYTDLYNSNAEMERTQEAANEAKAGILGLAEAMKGMSEAQFAKQYMDGLLETIRATGDPTGALATQWEEMALQYGFASEASLEMADKQGALNLLIESGIIPMSSMDEAIKAFFADAKDGQIDLLGLMEKFGNLDGASEDLGGAFYDLQGKLDELKTKYDQNGDGVLSAWEKTEKYRKELQDLKSALDAIMSKTVDLDVNVNVHGDTSFLDGWDPSPNKNPDDGYEYKALGGPVYPGDAVVVGERGPELLYPGFGGTVVPNKEIMKEQKGNNQITVVNNFQDTVLDDQQMIRVFKRMEVMGLI